MTDSDGYVVTTDYDALDRPTVTTYPDATFQQITYDKLDVSQTRDRRARVTQIGHDALRRVTSITDPLMRQTTFDWCQCGGLHQMIDALQHHTTWNRDLQGRVMSKVLHDGTSTSYVYETSTSRLKQMTDARNQKMNYQYFADDNLKQVSYTDATIPTPTVNYTYDPIYNRVATMADGTGTSAYIYHPVVAAPSPPQLGATQLASADGPFANDPITYSYDELGRVLSRGINGVSQSQSYDALGRISNLTNSLGNFVYGYEGVTNRLNSVEVPYDGGPAYTYFDNLGDRRLKQITNNGGDGGPGFHSRFIYAYQAEGQIYTITRQLTDQSIFKFTYDKADQMAIWILNGVKTGFYIYDLGGNRTQEKIGTATTNFTYNGVNELTDRTGAQGDASFTYDSNGSLISDGARTFEWDGANRLVAVNIGTLRSEFSYDGIGRRTRIVLKDNSVIKSEHTYVWCGGEICEERDASGATVQKRFFEQGEQVDGVTYYYTRDHLGSVRELLDYRGILLTRYDYDPWGRQTKLSGTQDAAFGYAGYFGHQLSGLLLTWYRAYDANLARWISRDPIEEKGGLNLYRYVGNAPVMFWDPTGLRRCNPIWGAIAGIVGGGLIGAGVGGLAATAAGAAAGAAGGTFVAPGVGTVGGGLVGAGAGAITGPIIGGVSGAIGGGLIAYYYCKGDADSVPTSPPPPPACDDRCKKVREQCLQACWADDVKVPKYQGPGTFSALRKCMRECMERNGCHDF